MTIKSYTATTDIPRVAKEGDTVELTERQARYHKLNGALVEAGNKTPVKQSDKQPVKEPVKTAKTTSKKPAGKKD